MKEQFSRPLSNSLSMGKNNMKTTYKVIIEKGQDGFFVAEAPELPGCYTQGKTLDETMLNIKEAIELYLEAKRELRQKTNKKFVQIGEVVINA